MSLAKLKSALQRKAPEAAQENQLTMINNHVNEPEKYAPLFNKLKPFSGTVKAGFNVDFVGVLVDNSFREMWGIDASSNVDRHVTTSLPVIHRTKLNNATNASGRNSHDNDEGWFETLGWVMAAQEARGTFVGVSLGAHYGHQLSGVRKVLDQINPMPSKLVAVEAGPENCEWIARHFAQNGIPQEDYWIIPMAIGANNDPIFFPIGGPGTGGNNCFSTNEPGARANYVDEFIKGGNTEEALRNLLLHNTTGINKDILPGVEASRAEIKLVSAVTLADILGPFNRVDYLESDIQQSELIAFPPYMDLLKRKVRHIHLGTHGGPTHTLLHDLFVRDGWEIIFSYPGDGDYESQLGYIKTNDGILSVMNPDLAYD